MANVYKFKIIGSFLSINNDQYLTPIFYFIQAFAFVNIFLIHLQQIMITIKNTNWWWIRFNSKA